MSYTVSILIQAVDRASGIFKDVGSATDGLNMRMAALQGVITGVAMAITNVLLNALQRLADAIIEGAHAYMRYEWTLVRIATATGALGEQARVLARRFEELTRGVGVRFAVGAEGAAAALEALVKAGLEGEEATKALEATLTLASIELMNAGETASYVVSILKAFSLSAEEASRVVDVLTNASIKGIATARDFAYALSYCSGIASQLGLSLEETTAALVAMNNQGIQATYAGRYLMHMLTDLVEKSDKLGFSIYDASGEMLSLSEIIARLQARLAQFSTEEERAAYLTRIFGAQGMRAVLALLNASYAGEKGAEALRALSEALGEAGTASAIFEEQMNTTAGAVARARARFREAMLTLGVALAPVIEKVAGLIEKLAPLISKVLVPAISAFVNVISMACDWLGPLADFLAENEWAITALGIAISGLMIAVNPLIGVLTMLPFMFSAVKIVVDALTMAFNALKTACEAAWSGIMAIVTVAWEAIGPILDALNAVLQAIISAVQFLMELWQGAWTAMQGVLETVWPIIGPILEAIRAALEAIMNAIDRLVGGFKWAGEQIGGFFSWVGEQVSGFCSWLVGGSIWPEMLKKMAKLLERWLGVMGGMFEEVLSGMMKRLEKFREETVGGSIWPETFELMLEQAEHYLGRTERLFEEWGRAAIITPGMGPFGGAPARQVVTSLTIHIHVDRFMAREPEDIERLAREITHQIARELRLRGVLVA